MLRRYVERVLPAPPPWLTFILSPIALLYLLAGAFHRYLYHIGILRSKKLPKPVISVGNLTVGGGGKTPVVLWLAVNLLKAGLNPAILSRGYGRKGAGTQIVDRKAGWNDAGDEPAMLAARLPDVPIAVSADRHAAGEELLRHRDADLFILDDGFQHRSLVRDLDIVVIDGYRKFGNSRLLPAGILREPLSRLKDADLIIVTKTGTRDPGFEDLLNRFSPAPIYWADYEPSSLSRPGFPGTHVDRESQPGPLLAFCGIAGPESFMNTLDRAGLQVVDILTYPDHHPYSRSDVADILKAARDKNAVGLVTTEKDAVRWPDETFSMPLYFLPVQVQIDEAERVLDHVLTLVSGEKTDRPK